MATNLSLDPDLIDRALDLSGERTKKAAVTRALEEFIARREQKHLLELMGNLEWDNSFDYKAERSRSGRCWSIPASGCLRFAAIQMVRQPRGLHCLKRLKAATSSSPPG